ncbi:MAG: hypothetical protein Q9219_004815 [cf. Caloplaca sp. 3 TL-2023]
MLKRTAHAKAKANTPTQPPPPQSQLSKTLPLLFTQTLQKTHQTMISDNDLYSLAVFLGCLSMLLIILYHFLEVNAQDDDGAAAAGAPVGEKVAQKGGNQGATSAAAGTERAR